MIKTGQLLKESREKQKIPLDDVATATKISLRVLKAIEEGIKEDLPSTSYLKGFVRSYAQFLQLDPNFVMSSFNEEMGVSHAVKRPPEEEPEAEEPSWTEKVPFFKDRSAASMTFAAAGIVILILLIVGIQSTIKKYEEERILPQTPYTVESLENKEVENQQASIETVETIEASPAPKESTEDKVEVVKKEQPKEEVPVVATPPPTKEVEKVAEESIIKEVEAETKPEVQKPTPTTSKKPQEVIVEALDSVVLRFRIDDGGLERIKLKPDQVHTIKAGKKVSIDLSDGGAVNIVHNGRDKGVPGDLGKSIKLKFP